MPCKAGPQTKNVPEVLNVYIKEIEQIINFFYARVI